MSNWQLTSKHTDNERSEHVQRIRSHADEIAEKLRNGEALLEHERAFAAVIVSEWAATYSPKRSRGQAPQFSHIDAAMFYALERNKNQNHDDVIHEISERVDKSYVAIWNAIAPLYPDVCAYLQLAPKPIPE